MQPSSFFHNPSSFGTVTQYVDSFPTVNLWLLTFPPQAVTYSFMSGNANQQAKVDQGFIEWSHYMNLVFTRVNTAGQVRITFDPTTGSWSYVGKQVLDVDPTKPTMNLGWVDGSSVTASPIEMGTILHEIGHTLGLVHESLAPSRGGYVFDTNGMYPFG